MTVSRGHFQDISSQPSPAMDTQPEGNSWAKPWGIRYLAPALMETGPACHAPNHDSPPRWRGLRSRSEGFSTLHVVVVVAEHCRPSENQPQRSPISGQSQPAPGSSPFATSCPIG